MSDQSILNSGPISSQHNVNAETVHYHQASSQVQPYWFSIDEEDSGNIRWRGNIAPNKLSLLWQPSAIPAHVEFRAELFKFESLANAILRLAIHSDQLTLSVTTTSDWEQAARAIVMNCIGATGETWKPNNVSTSTVGWRLRGLAPVLMESDANEVASYSPSSIAQTIEEHLDEWVVYRLHGSLHHALLNGDITQTHCPIESNLASLMWGRWQDWKRALDGNPALRRHFLSVMLTTAHNESEMRAFARVGRRTLNTCILRPVVFALGIALAVEPGCTPSNTHEAANLVLNTQNAHLVGVELFKDRLIKLALNEIYWKAPFVLLPHVDRSPEELRRMQRRIIDGPAAGLSMRKGVLATPALLTSHDFYESCQQGLNALRQTVLSTLESLSREHGELLSHLSSGGR